MAKTIPDKYFTVETGALSRPGHSDPFMRGDVLHPSEIRTFNNQSSSYEPMKDTEQFDRLVSRGALREATDKEIADYKERGPRRDSHLVTFYTESSRTTSGGAEVRAVTDDAAAVNTAKQGAKDKTTNPGAAKDQAKQGGSSWVGADGAES